MDDPDRGLIDRVLDSLAALGPLGDIVVAAILLPVGALFWFGWRKASLLTIIAIGLGAALVSFGFYRYFRPRTEASRLELVIVCLVSTAGLAGILTFFYFILNGPL